jgi:hypothetical protein
MFKYNTKVWRPAKPNKLYNFRIKKYVLASDIGRGLYAVEDFMPNKNGVEEKVIGDYVKDGNYLREI